MDKNAIIKWVLIAGAAYLVYRYLDSSGFFGTATTDLPATQPNQTVVPAQITDGSATTQTATTAPTSSEITESLKAAMTANGFDPVEQYGGYEWAWFWQRASLYNGKDIGPTELGISDTEKVYLASAVSAIEKVLSPGLAGLEALMADRRMMSAWTM
jgi:hypothetical protein